MKRMREQRDNQVDRDAVNTEKREGQSGRQRDS